MPSQVFTLPRHTNFNSNPSYSFQSKARNEKSTTGALKLSSSKKKSGVNEDDLLSELMSDTIQNKPVSQGSAWDTDWNDMKDSFVQDDNWTQSFFQQETKTNMEKVWFAHVISV